MVRADELGRIKRGEAYIKAFQEYPAKTSLIPIFYHTLPAFKGYKEEFLVEKESKQVFKPKHFDLSELTYDIEKRQALFEPKKPVLDTKKKIDDELSEVLNSIPENKKEAIIQAFSNKKYNLVISNLRALAKDGLIKNVDAIITEIKNLKK